VIKNYIAKAGGSLNKLQSLINDLLDVSKIKAGRLEYAVTDVNTSDLIGQCMENAIHMYPLILLKAGRVEITIRYAATRNGWSKC
jgi:two-component system phosphate regulon sensor histidine kinase PhoR